MVYQIIPSVYETYYRKTEHEYKSKKHNRREKFYKDKHLEMITNGEKIKQVILQFYGSCGYFSIERGQIFCLLTGLDIGKDDSVIVDVPKEMINNFGSLIGNLIEFQTIRNFKLYICYEEAGNGNQWRSIRVA